MNVIASRAQLRASLLRWSLFTVPLVLLLGFLAGQLAGPATPWFQSLVKPDIYPPPATFGIVFGDGHWNSGSIMGRGLLPAARGYVGSYMDIFNGGRKSHTKDLVAGMVAVFGDTSTRMITEGVDLRTFCAMVTRAGGENVGAE